MCGITGYRVLSADSRPWADDLPRAIESLHHRGPDDAGKWLSDDARTGLGHRRLSILDLSAHGHQPMFSRCGQWAMVFNGEVYNYREIRAELEPLGHQFAGTGDSEVILAGFAEWGAQAVQRFIGMFAIALWHKPTRELHLLRDRLGVKPLYYYWDGQVLAFGSELKALRAFRAWEPGIDPEALNDFLRYGYINDPRSIYRNVRKLPPAHHLCLGQSGQLQVSQYWSVLDHVGRRQDAGEQELEEELEALLVSAFKYRMIADVPVGVFLSGGIDSSVLAALLQKHGGQRIKTFTIGFDQPEYDESPFAADVAEYLGTEHYSRILKVDDAKALLPRWGDLYDEPFGDESGIPTLLVSQVAAERVKVVLSADGGDELFSGYNAYESTLHHWARTQRLSPAVRRGASLALRSIAIDDLDDFLGAHARVGSVTDAFRGRIVSRLSRIGAAIGASTIGSFYDALLLHFRSRELGQLLGRSIDTRGNADQFPGVAGEKLCFWDLHNYLPGDVLTKVDRATMAVSIEGREPLLDHRLTEFAFSLPFGMRRGELGGKHILKRVLFKHVPQRLVDRPKRGFGVPVKHWLATDLRPMVDDLLDPIVIRQQGLFDASMVQRYVSRLRAGDISVRQRVWLLVAFQMWHRRWMHAK
jgi:asparagine synthase (glutamine-hydrolysing)